MLPLLAIVLTSATADQSDRLTFEGVSFGPQLTLTCDWVTNFETNLFLQCRSAGKDMLPTDEAASIKCVGKACEKMDVEAQNATDPLTWGSFKVRIVGRVGVKRHKRQSLGDGTRTVLVEQVLDVRVSN